jgi:transcriptional regulator with XRE-family HTH domain
MHGDFTRQLIEARARLGLTQGEFAARVGVSQGAVSRWEKGRQKPNAEVLMRLGKLGAGLPRITWSGAATSYGVAPAARMAGSRARLRLRPLETSRRRLSDHLRASIECALNAGKDEFARQLQPILTRCIEADRRDPRGRRRVDDTASMGADLE